MRIIAIVSPGTGVGKTLVTTSLAYQLSQSKINIRVIKPIISGFEEDNNDTIEILRSLKQPITEDNINKVSPWRFIAPLAPNIASQRENKTIILQEVIDFCCNADFNIGKEYLLIEIAGGILSPINNYHTMIDLISAVNAEILLVTGNYLGSISHTLMAYKLIKYYNLKLTQVIMCQIERESNIILDETFTTLKNFIEEPIMPIKFIEIEENKRQYMPKISII